MLCIGCDFQRHTAQPWHDREARVGYFATFHICTQTVTEEGSIVGQGMRDLFTPFAPSYLPLSSSAARLVAKGGASKK